LGCKLVCHCEESRSDDEAISMLYVILNVFFFAQQKKRSEESHDG
jgi:hypothetical protein